MSVFLLHNPPHESRESGFWNLGNFCWWNLKSWVLESGIQLKESGIPLTIGIRYPSSNDRESGIQYLESGIHGVESNPRLSWIPLRGATITCKAFNQNDQSRFSTLCVWLIYYFSFLKNKNFSMK